MSPAEIIVAGATGYLQVGLCVALPFALFGVGHIEPSARGGSSMFKLLIVPGATLLWPWVVMRAATVIRAHLKERS